MSDDLVDLGEPAINVTSFYAGRDKGRSLQLTPVRLDLGYAVLTRDDVVRLVDELRAWLAPRS